MSNNIETAAVLKLKADEFTAPAKKALGVVGKLDRSLKTTQKDLSRLKNDRSKIGAFSQLRKQSNDVRDSLDIQQQEVKRLAKAYQTASNSTKQLENEFKSAKNEADSLKQQYSHQATLLTELKQQSNSARIAVSDQRKEVNRLKKEYRASKNPSEQLTQEFADAEEKLTSLKQSYDIHLGSLKKLKKESDDAKGALNDQQQKVARLSKAYYAAEKPTKALAREFDNAKKKASQLKQQHNRQVTSLEQLRRELKKAGVETRNLSKHDRRLARDIEKTTTSIRQQERVLKQYHASLKRYQKISDTSKGIAGKATVVGAGGLGFAWMGSRAIGAAGEYKALLADVAVTAGMSNKEIGTLKNTISDLTDVTFKSRDVLGDGVKVLIASGFNLQQTLGSLPAIGKTATAADAEVQEVSKTSFSLIDNLKVPVEELGRALDMLTEAGKLGRFELRDMAQYFPSLTAQAKRLGLEGTEGVATLGAALQIALRGAADPSEAANNMKNFLAKVTSPETIKRATDIYGINLERELKAATRKGLNPLEFMLKRVHQLTKGDAFRVGELFGDLQVQQFLTPMMANLKEYKSLKNSVLSASGTVDADLKRRVELDPTIGWKNLADDLAELRDDAVEPLLPVLKDLFADIKPIIQSMSEWIKENPKLTKTLIVGAASVIGLTAVLAPLVALIASSVTIWAMWRIGMSKLFMPIDKTTRSAGRLSTFLKGLGKTLLWVGRSALPIVGKAVLWLGRALMANPIGLAVTAIAGGAYLIIKHWKPLKQWFSDLWKDIIDGAKSIQNWWNNLWGDKQTAKATLETSKQEKHRPANDPIFRNNKVIKLEDRKSKIPIASSYAPLKPTYNKHVVVHEGNTVLNVYPSPGMDEERLAQLVNQKLESHQRDLDRRKRGLLHEG